MSAVKESASAEPHSNIKVSSVGGFGGLVERGWLVPEINAVTVQVEPWYGKFPIIRLPGVIQPYRLSIANTVKRSVLDSRHLR